jgi:hypothetical protein
MPLFIDEKTISTDIVIGRRASGGTSSGRAEHLKITMHDPTRGRLTPMTVLEGARAPAPCPRMGDLMTAPTPPHRPTR